MKSVKVYSTSACPWCTRVKDFLKENNVSFVDVNVGIDKEAAREMVEKSGQMGVPVIDIDGMMTIGFDEARLRELLNLE